MAHMLSRIEKKEGIFKRGSNSNTVFNARGGRDRRKKNMFDWPDS